MTKEELEKIYGNIQFQMFVEQKIENRNEYSKSLQEKMNLYNYVIDLKQTLNEIRKVITECKMLMSHEFDWEEQAEGILQIIDKVGGNDDNK